MKKAALLLALAPALVHADTPKQPPGTPAAPAAAPPVPPKAPTPPKPSAEISELAAGMAGTWKCKGKAMTPTGETSATSTIVNKVDLDKWFIQTSFSGKLGTWTYKFTSYIGFNTVEQKFTRFLVDNMGGTEVSTAVAIDHAMGGKWGMHWEGEAHEATKGFSGSNLMKTRETEAYSNSGLDLTGEMSVDGGKTWQSAYTVSCKK
ncbi:MAG TPA: hypothetical protein VGM90_38505 [Kofleriaceae bacterium]|jgi:phenylpyruvate tautomerase PptA (4-oxalocrotonate tautomerase family)